MPAPCVEARRVAAISALGTLPKPPRHPPPVVGAVMEVVVWLRTGDTQAKAVGGDAYSLECRPVQ